MVPPVLSFCAMIEATAAMANSTARDDRLSRQMAVDASLRQAIGASSNAHNAASDAATMYAAADRNSVSSCSMSSPLAFQETVLVDR